MKNNVEMSWLLVLRLAAHDLRTRALGSMFGFAWSFVQPFVMTVILWFVFALVANAGAIRGVPFLAWLLAGMSVWSFFSEALNQATGVFCEYAFMARKVNFQLVILPPVKIFAALAVHLVFLFIVAVVLLLNGIPISRHWLGVLYYLFAAVVLLSGLSYITAGLHVFLRDVGQMVNVALQFGFWITPVFWDFGMLPLKDHPFLVFILRLNPMVYIVEGYRNSLLFSSPFASGWGEAVYFWGIASGLLGLGALLFRKLRPQFADVL